MQTNKLFSQDLVHLLNRSCMGPVAVMDCSKSDALSLAHFCSVHHVT